MSGPRRPMAVNLASGSKHWTKDEVEQRQAQEAQVPKPVKLTCPGWLCPEAKKLFRGYAKELLGSTLPVSRLDTGTLARLCDAEALYAKAAEKRDAAFETDDEGFALWMKTMASCEKIARGAANDLGCTISSRCRMVVPKAETDEEENPLERLRLLREGVV